MESPQDPPPPSGEENPYESPTSSQVPYGPEPPGMIEQNSDAKTWGMLAHLSGLAMFLGIPSFVGPLIIWLIKKDEHPFVDDQGKEALNFQICMIIAIVISAASMFACVGFVLLPAVFIVDLVFCIIAAMKANNGEYYRYPFNIRMVT